MGHIRAYSETGALTLNDFRGGTVEDERRIRPRAACERVVAIMPCDGPGDRRFRKARLVDCSPEGVGLLTARPMEAGQQFLLKLKLGQIRLVLYTVAHCRKDRNRYRIGAAFAGFIGTPTEHDTNSLLLALRYG